MRFTIDYEMIEVRRSQIGLAFFFQFISKNDYHFLKKLLFDHSNRHADFGQLFE